MTTTNNAETTIDPTQDPQPTPGSELVEKVKQHAKDEPVAAAAVIIGILNLFS
jgi:hypothetical protein